MKLRMAVISNSAVIDIIISTAVRWENDFL